MLPMVDFAIKCSVGVSQVYVFHLCQHPLDPLLPKSKEVDEGARTGVVWVNHQLLKLLLIFFSNTLQRARAAPSKLCKTKKVFCEQV